MILIRLKAFLGKCLIVAIIFLCDRVSKIYIINFSETENISNIYINSYLNLNLIWNGGIAFGLLSYENNIIYNIITGIIILVSFAILIMIIKSNDIRKYFLLFIMGGATGNIFDRIYYSAVPDFIDFHIKDFHWFIFNIADIFITMGVICLIVAELLLDKKNDDE
tara:strand:- start:3300 stop:3794 length:495 start_codon:yes stop_codon:yes gene_type:complete